MSDVLALSIPLGSTYPSVNHLHKDGFIGGRKSDAYKTLFADVKTAAEAEIARTGWETASTECALTVIRYQETRRRSDATNLAKVEADALTAAGVWADDRLATPVTLMVRFDPAGQHRLAIVVVKLHEATTESAQVGKKSAPRRPRAAKPPARPAPFVGDAVDRWRPGDTIPDGYALLGSKLVTMEFALEKIRE